MRYHQLFSNASTNLERSPRSILSLCTIIRNDAHVLYISYYARFESSEVYFVCKQIGINLSSVPILGSPGQHKIEI
ncbi:unnamed protein product [Fusarium graminearum]|nr:unnamed protein product [Fusarium graminearum]CAG1981725.1 unnamed protein product [Fusarium graminearum]VTO90473.1 unnamed protein product [Fusarium graminearum]